MFCDHISSIPGFALMKGILQNKKSIFAEGGQQGWGAIEPNITVEVFTIDQVFVSYSSFFKAAIPKPSHSESRPALIPTFGVSPWVLRASSQSTPHPTPFVFPRSGFLSCLDFRERLSRTIKSLDVTGCSKYWPLDFATHN